MCRPSRRWTCTTQTVRAVHLRSPQAPIGSSYTSTAKESTMHKVMAFLLLASGITFAQRSTPVPVTYTATSTDVTLKNSSTQPILALRVTVKGVKAIDVYEHDFF